MQNIAWINWIDRTKDATYISDYIVLTCIDRVTFVKSHARYANEFPEDVSRIPLRTHNYAAIFGENCD